MEQLAGWVATIATIVAAMMTAANLGARVTGWGFVIFTMGSAAWMATGLLAGQTHLVVANSVLAMINIVGVRRWLGRRAMFEAAAARTARLSRHASAPSLFPVSWLEGRTVRDTGGDEVGKIVGAMAKVRTGRIAYVVLELDEEAGTRQGLRAIAWRELRLCDDDMLLMLPRAQLAQRAGLDPDLWPVRPAQSI